MGPEAEGLFRAVGVARKRSCRGVDGDIDGGVDGGVDGYKGLRNLRSAAWRVG
jgi:hypothetical protein